MEMWNNRGVFNNRYVIQLAGQKSAWASSRCVPFFFPTWSEGCSLLSQTGKTGSAQQLERRVGGDGEFCLSHLILVQNESSADS